MAIQIIISGDHATDALSELHVFARGLFANAPGTAVVGVVENVGLSATSYAVESVEEFLSKLVAEESEPVGKVKRTRKPKSEVVAAVASVESAIVVSEDVNLFGDVTEDTTAHDPVVTVDTLKALIMEKTKDADGKDDARKNAAVFALVKSAIPKGKDMKVSISNIPEDKLLEVYYEVVAL